MPSRRNGRRLCTAIAALEKLQCRSAFAAGDREERARSIVCAARNLAVAQSPNQKLVANGLKAFTDMDDARLIDPPRAGNNCFD